MVPRLTPLAVLEALNHHFKDRTSLIKSIMDRIGVSRGNQVSSIGNSFIFQSFCPEEKKIFATITSVVPTCIGKRGVILCNRRQELEELGILLRRLFPGLEVKVMYDLQKYWWGTDSLDQFMAYDVLLCKPHDFLRLKHDFKAILTNIGAVCFHDLIPSEWYYPESVALALKLAFSSRAPKLFFSSPSELPHIRVIIPNKPIKTYTIPPLREDLHWYALINPFRNPRHFQRYLKKVITTVCMLEPNHPRTRDNVHNQGKKKSLVLLHRMREADFNDLMGDFGPDQLEVIYPDTWLNELGEINILFIEDVVIPPSDLTSAFPVLINHIVKILSYLKRGGKVIFFAPYGVRETDILLSSIFPIPFTWTQKELFLIFLLFQGCLLKKELLALLEPLWYEHWFQLTPITLKSLLNSLRRDQLVHSRKGRYTCARIQSRQTLHIPDGRTIVRYRSFLEYKIQSHVFARHRHEIKTQAAFNYFTALSKELAALAGYCPHIRHVQEILQILMEDISPEEIEWALINRPARYRYSLYLLSQRNPAFERYNPYKNDSDEGEEPLTGSLADWRHQLLKPYLKVPPPGRRGWKSQDTYATRKRVLLEQIRELVADLKRPIHWQVPIEQLGLKRTTGFRLVQELLAEGALCEVKSLFLEPKYLDEETNELRYRGRPRKYVIPQGFDISLLPNQQCGRCCFFTRTNRCVIISSLLQIKSPEHIPNTAIRDLLLHKKVSPNLRIHPRMGACEYFRVRNRDYELKALPLVTSYESADGTEGWAETDFYACTIEGCNGLMEWDPHFRTLKCPKCHTKYTRFLKDDGTKVIKVNVDVKSTRTAVVQAICGVYDDEGVQERQKKKVTKRYRTLERIVRRNSTKKEETTLLTYDRELRIQLQRKYGTEQFYKRRILAILLSCILATLELKTLGIVEEWIIDRHVYVQLEQIRRCSKHPTIEQLRTAERIIANQYWQVCKQIFRQIGFHLSSRKLMRYVKEFLEYPFRGSKGYTPGNTLINNIHKIRYEHLRELLRRYGFGYECPGCAEHTNPKFGLVLDLADLVKVADRFTLIQAIINQEITAEDLYSILGRHNQEIYLVKRKAFRKLVRIIEETDRKYIYPIIEITNHNFIYQEVPLGKAFEQFMENFVQNLRYNDHLEAVFVYAPDIDDYIYAVSYTHLTLPTN